MSNETPTGTDTSLVPTATQESAMTTQESTTSDVVQPVTKIPQMILPLESDAEMHSEDVNMSRPTQVVEAPVSPQ